MKIETNLSKPELTKALQELLESNYSDDDDEDVDELVIENVVDRLDTVEKDLENYLEALYGVDKLVEKLSEEVSLIRSKDVPGLKLAMTMLFCLGLANIILLLSIFRPGF